MARARKVFLIVVGITTIIGLVGLFLNKQLPLEKEGKEMVFVVSICFLAFAVLAGSISLHSSDEAFEEYD